MLSGYQESLSQQILSDNVETERKFQLFRLTNGHTGLARALCELIRRLDQ
ncbi:MAG: hypothetical protein WBV22_06560 [Anaerolineaceae bacterium]